MHCCWGKQPWTHFGGLLFFMAGGRKPLPGDMLHLLAAARGQDNTCLGKCKDWLLLQGRRNLSLVSGAVQLSCRGREGGGVQPLPGRQEGDSAPAREAGHQPARMLELAEGLWVAHTGSLAAHWDGQRRRWTAPLVPIGVTSLPLCEACMLRPEQGNGV